MHLKKMFRIILLLCLTVVVFGARVHHPEDVQIDGDTQIDGTLTVAPFTQGSVPFIGASGLFSQDNSKLFWDNTNKRLAVGTNTSSTMLNISQAQSGTHCIPAISLSGYEYYQSGSSETVGGVSLMAGVNRDANRQLWITESDSVGLSNRSTFRFYSGNRMGTIDAARADGSTRLTVGLGTDTSSVVVGDHGSFLPYDVSIPASFAVYGRDGVATAMLAGNPSGDKNFLEFKTFKSGANGMSGNELLLYVSPYGNIIKPTESLHIIAADGINLNPDNGDVRVEGNLEVAGWIDSPLFSTKNSLILLGDSASEFSVANHYEDLVQPGAEADYYQLRLTGKPTGNTGAYNVEISTMTNAEAFSGVGTLGVRTFALVAANHTDKWIRLDSDQTVALLDNDTFTIAGTTSNDGANYKIDDATITYDSDNNWTEASLHDGDGYTALSATNTYPADGATGVFPASAVTDEYTNTFKWQVDGGDFSDDIVTHTGYYELQTGIKILFSDVEGTAAFSASDAWTFTVAVVALPIFNIDTIDNIITIAGSADNFDALVIKNTQPDPDVTGFLRVNNNGGLGVVSESANVTLVPASGSNVYINTSGASLLPHTNNSGDIGATDRRFANIWAGTDIFAGDNFLASGGAVDAPSYTFSGFSSTGMWMSQPPPVAYLNFSVGGTKIADYRSTGLVVSDNLDIMLGGTGYVTSGSEGFITGEASLIEDKLVLNTDGGAAHIGAGSVTFSDAGDGADLIEVIAVAFTAGNTTIDSAEVTIDSDLVLSGGSIVDDSGSIAFGATAFTGVGAIGCASLTATGAVEGDSITDGVFTATGGDFSSVGTIGCGAITSTGLITGTDLDINMTTSGIETREWVYAEAFNVAELYGTGTTTLISIADTLYIRDAADDGSCGVIFSDPTGSATNSNISYTIATDTMAFENAAIYLFDAPIYFTQTDGEERIDSDADGTLDLYAGTSIDLHDDTNITGAVTLGDGTNELQVSGTGDATFGGSAGFYPRYVEQAGEPANGTGATQIDDEELIMWRDTDNDNTYLMFNSNGDAGVVKVQLN